MFYGGFSLGCLGGKIKLYYILYIYIFYETI